MAATEANSAEARKTLAPGDWPSWGKDLGKSWGNPWKKSDFTRKIWEEMVISLGKLGRSGDFVGIDWEVGISAIFMMAWGEMSSSLR